MSNEKTVDYAKAEADIVAYWNELTGGDGNLVWYMATGDIHNLMDVAVDKIEQQRELLTKCTMAIKALLGKEIPSVAERVARNVLAEVEPES